MARTPTTRRRVTKPRQKTYIAIVLDSSSSIGHSRLTASVRQTFNNIKATLQRKSALKNQDVYVSLITFNDRVNEPLFKHANVNMIPDLDHTNYNPGGGTALFDAVASAIALFDNVPTDENTSFLIHPITDGEELNSVFTTASDLKRMIVNREDKGNWTFAFQLPVGRREVFCRQFGIAIDNVNEWELTEIGTRKMSDETSNAVSNYMDNRARGVTQTKGFFKATPDLSKVNVKKQLDDLAASFRLFTVANESIIRGFVEEQTGKDYIPGTAFYQLVKPEKVQPSKEVLIQEKNTGRTKKIYGGPEARDLIGLPRDQHAKIVPGNHGNYDIFIQSKSVNRILPRGTKLLLAK